MALKHVFCNTISIISHHDFMMIFKGKRNTCGIETCNS